MTTPDEVSASPQDHPEAYGLGLRSSLLLSYVLHVHPVCQHLKQSTSLSDSEVEHSITDKRGFDPGYGGSSGFLKPGLESENNLGLQRGRDHDFDFFRDSLIGGNIRAAE